MCSSDLVVACLLLVLLHLAWSSPAFAIGTDSGAAADTNSPRVSPRRSPAGVGQAPTTEIQSEGPRNPYDMEALRQFDAGSHRTEEAS